MADLALQMLSWTDPVGDLTTKFFDIDGNTPPPLALLEVLTVLPEESASQHLRLGGNRRMTITNYLVESATTVMKVLVGIMP